MVDKALVPIAKKAVTFCEYVLMAFLVPLADKQQVYFPLRPICHYLGQDWLAPMRRIRSDSGLRRWATFFAITAPNPEAAKRGRKSNRLRLALDYFIGFLRLLLRQVVATWPQQDISNRCEESLVRIRREAELLPKNRRRSE